VTNKWHVEQRREVGIFGVCNYYKTFSYSTALNCTHHCAFDVKKCCDNGQMNATSTPTTNFKSDMHKSSVEESQHKGLVHSMVHKKCFQLVFPDTVDAINYLKGNSTLALHTLNSILTHSFDSQQSLFITRQ
jgi:hypothetical protein